MNDTITVCGIIATEPRHLVTETGIAITSMRLASPSRRWDRATATWTNGATNWFTITAFRSLAANVHKSVKKGDRVVVTGASASAPGSATAAAAPRSRSTRRASATTSPGASATGSASRDRSASRTPVRARPGGADGDPHTGEVTGTVPEDVPPAVLPTDDEAAVPAPAALGDLGLHDVAPDDHEPAHTTEDDDRVVAVLRGTDPDHDPRAVA